MDLTLIQHAELTTQLSEILPLCNFRLSMLTVTAEIQSDRLKFRHARSWVLFSFLVKQDLDDVRSEDKMLGGMIMWTVISS